MAGKPSEAARVFPARPAARTDKQIDDDLALIAREMARVKGGFLFELLTHARNVLTGWKAR